MKRIGITKVTVRPGSAGPHGDTDWQRLDALTEAEGTAAAEDDPDALPLSPEALAGMKRVSRVKALRQRLGMTQAEFAEVYCIPLGTLRDWEQHRATPDAPARALLRAIENDPETMRRLLEHVA